MSDPSAREPQTRPQGDERRAPTPWMPPNAGTTPNAERYLLEADALRRRQLHSALLHGSSRTWRDQRRIWPGVVAGIVVVAVILATFAVIKAFKKSEENDRQQTSFATYPGSGARGCADAGTCAVRAAGPLVRSVPFVNVVQVDSPPPRTK